MLKFLLRRVLVGYINIIRRVEQRTPYIHGDKTKADIGKRVSLMNTIINTSSGYVTIGDDTIFGHGCMLLSGVHQFEDGVRKKILGYERETPTYGHDISIGQGCWICSGSIILGGTNIGNNCIIKSCSWDSSRYKYLSFKQ